MLTLQIVNYLNKGIALAAEVPSGDPERRCFVRIRATAKPARCSALTTPPWSSQQLPCKNVSCRWPSRPRVVRFLIDASLSPKVAVALGKSGFESVHVGDVGLLTASDRSILGYAVANLLVIVSADTDFGELLAASRGARRPSVVLLRSADRLTTEQ